LGPTARLYLLKTGSLSRLLRILLNFSHGGSSVPPSNNNDNQMMHDLMPLIEIVRNEEQENGGGYLKANMQFIDERML